MSKFKTEIDQMLEKIKYKDCYEKNECKDVITISKKLGYTIKYFIPENEEEAKASGILDPKNKDIYINSLETEKRQRFTIAHEIAHIVLHVDENQEEPVYEYRNDKISLKEFNANEFAGELLMPINVIEQYISDIPKYQSYIKKLYSGELSLDDDFAEEDVIVELVNLFNVSKSSMEVRILKLNSK